MIFNYSMVVYSHKTVLLNINLENHIDSESFYVCWNDLCSRTREERVSFKRILMQIMSHIDFQRFFL